MRVAHERCSPPPGFLGKVAETPHVIADDALSFLKWATTAGLEVGSSATVTWREERVILELASDGHWYVDPCGGRLVLKEPP